MRRRRGKYIVVEGTDGSGKSKSAAGLSARLKIRDIPHVFTREPRRDGAEGARIYEILESGGQANNLELQELIIVNREWHFREVVLPALEQGLLVLSDRNFFSNVAYAIGIDPEFMLEKNKQFLKPDLWFYLTAPVEICLARKIAEGKSTDRFNNKEDLAKTVETYELLTERFPNVKRIETHPQTLDEVVGELETHFFTFYKQHMSARIQAA